MFEKMMENLLKETTVSELNRLWQGLQYHIGELSSFMLKHRDDPFFQTENGKMIRTYSAEFCRNHMMGSMILSTEVIREAKEPKTNNEDESNENTTPGLDIEKMLADIINGINDGQSNEDNEEEPEQGP